MVKRDQAYSSNNSNNGYSGMKKRAGEIKTATKAGLKGLSNGPTRSGHATPQKETSYMTFNENQHQTKTAHQ